MKSSYLRGFCLVLGLVGLVQSSIAVEPFGSATLLPMPSTQDKLSPYPLVSPTSYGAQEQLSPSDPAPLFPPPPVGSDYQNAMKQSWDNAGVDSSCGQVVEACCGRPCPRFALWSSGLVLGRAHLCNRPVTQEGGTLQNTMGTADAAQQYSGGFEVGGAWIMPNCCNAISIGYWGIFPGSQNAFRGGPDFPAGISPVLGNIDQLSYDDGTTTDTVLNRMTTTTGAHYITTNSTFNSLEFNFLGNTQAWGLVPFNSGCGSCNGCNSCGCNRWMFGWMAGVRYFQFNESFLMQTDSNDTSLGDAGDADELRYCVHTNNSLWGFQMGGQGAWYLNNCFSFYGSGRFGVFNNYITSEQYVNGNAGDAFINSGTFAGTSYRFNTSRNALAGVGQIDLGLRYQLGCHWSVFGGYRVVGLSGVATAPAQIPQNFANQPLTICAGNSVLLNGAFLGAQFAW